jgi:hypothetical protein
MAPLFDLDGPCLDPGYRNLRAGARAEEREIKATLETMWLHYQPYADTDFADAFARDPDARFWEIFVGCALLEAGKILQRRVNRPQGRGHPDLCVVDGERRIWIEATAPSAGDGGDDQVPDIVPLGVGGIQDQPIRPVQLRITSAVLAKTRKFDRYRTDGVIGENDVCLIAVGGGRFGLQAGGPGFPLALSAVYPIGDQFARINRENGEIVGHGYHHAEEIERAGGNIPRSAFLSPQFAGVSGLIWSRASIGNMVRAVRPLSLIHNYAARNRMPQRWGCWDKEYPLGSARAYAVRVAGRSFLRRWATGGLSACMGQLRRGSWLFSGIRLDAHRDVGLGCRVAHLLAAPTPPSSRLLR